MTVDEERNKASLPIPVFFVSVASKGVSLGISLLFATLAEGFISVAAKGLMQASEWRERTFVRLNDFEGVLRTTWWTERVCSDKFKKHYSTFVQFVNSYL